MIASSDDLFSTLLATWSRGDGAGYGQVFCENADYIGFEGTRTHGREPIVTWHQYLFDRWLRGSRLQGQIESVGFLSPSVALIHTTGGRCPTS